MGESNRTIKEIVEKIRGLNKPKYFLEIYEELFKPLKEKEIVLMEIGVADGGSIKLWECYFNKAKIVGVDSGVETHHKNEHSYGERVSIRQCDQLDSQLTDTEYDVIIDDGGHTMRQQIGSCKMLLPKVKKGGLYIIEDLETSYASQFRDYNQTTMQFLMEMVNEINKQNTDINSISFYKNLCVIRKYG